MSNLTASRGKQVVTGFVIVVAFVGVFAPTQRALAADLGWGDEYFVADDTGYDTLGGWGNEYFAPDSSYGTEYFASDSYWGNEYFAPDNSYGTEYFAPDQGCGYSCYGTTQYSYPSVGYSTGGSSYSSSYPHTTFSSTPVVQSYPISVSSGVPSRPTQTPSSPVSSGSSNYSNYSSTSYVDNSYTDNSINNSFNTGSNINSAGAVAAGTSISIIPLATQQYNTQYTYPAPSCSITLSNYGSVSGQATLTWNAYNTNGNPTISGVGSVSNYGTRTVYPYNGQSYTMIVYGQGGNSTCQTSSYYAYTPPVYMPAYTTPTYVPPVAAAPYVALTQIPYTGFDLGPIGNTMYWFGLALFAVAGAYLMIYYTPSFSLASMFSSRTKSPIKVMLPAPVAKPTVFVAKEIQLDEEAIRQAASDRQKVTHDYMGIIPSRGGSAPRIVISRA